MSVAGACLCGAVAFELTPPLRDAVSCHCSQCRKFSGHYWSATSVPEAQFRLVTDQGLRWFRSSVTAERGFCGRCGAALFWRQDGEGRISVAAGALEAPTWIGEAKHIFCDDKGDYYPLAGDVPRIGQW